MALEQELQAISERLSSQFSDEVKEMVKAGLSDLVASGIDQNALKEGDVAPDFELPDESGQIHSLDNMLYKGMLILSFNRGNWCPYCVSEILALQASMSIMNMDEVNVAVLMPQVQAESLALKSDNRLEMPILFDNSLTVAKKFGVDFVEKEEIRNFHESIGLNESEIYGEGYQGELPMPAMYVINRDKKIVYAYVNPNWMERSNPEDYMGALNS